MGTRTARGATILLSLPSAESKVEEAGPVLGACGLAVTIARKVVFVRGLVVENQRSVQRTA